MGHADLNGRLAATPGPLKATWVLWPPQLSAYGITSWPWDLISPPSSQSCTPPSAPHTPDPRAGLVFEKIVAPMHGGFTTTYAASRELVAAACQHVLHPSLEAHQELHARVRGRRRCAHTLARHMRTLVAWAR